jgi:hypothetical protein
MGYLQKFGSFGICGMTNRSCPCPTPVAGQSPANGGTACPTVRARAQARARTKRRNLLGPIRPRAPRKSRKSQKFGSELVEPFARQTPNRDVQSAWRTPMSRRSAWTTRVTAGPGQSVVPPRISPWV